MAEKEARDTQKEMRSRVAHDAKNLPHDSVNRLFRPGDLIQYQGSYGELVQATVIEIYKVDSGVMKLHLRPKMFAGVPFDGVDTYVEKWWRATILRREKPSWSATETTKP